MDAGLAEKRAVAHPVRAADERRARPGLEDRDVDEAIRRVRLVELAPAAERARAGDDDLPRRAHVALLAIDDDPDAQRRRGEPGAQRADRVGERPERALERARAVSGDDRQPDARGVEERAIAGAQHVDRALARLR